MYQGLKRHQKETPAQVFSSEFCEMFQKTLFAEHLWMTASAYFSVPTKVLPIDQFFCFFLHFFFSYIIDNCSYVVCSERL